jgi:methionyl-tRNA formyltransferase
VSGLKGFHLLSTLLGKIQIGSVYCYQRNDVEGTYNDQIMALAKDQQLDLKVVTRITEEYIDHNDIVFVVGWQYLFTPSRKFVVVHDSVLPKYRGFAPTVTALLNREPSIGVSAFFPSEKVDAGKVIASKQCNIDYPIRLYDALLLQAENSTSTVLDVVDKLSIDGLDGVYEKAVPQDDACASYAVWRDAQDHLINWNMASSDIQNFVYALSYPYEGAFTYCGDKKIVITDCEVCADLIFERRDVGKIWMLDEGFPVVICGDGMLKITKAECDGEAYHFTRLKARLE